MAKLKCTRHDRRIMYWNDANDKAVVVHRNDGLHCEGLTVQIGSKWHPISTLEGRADQYDLGRGERTVHLAGSPWTIGADGKSQDYPATEELLHEIFTDGG